MKTSPASARRGFTFSQACLALGSVQERQASQRDSDRVRNIFTSEALLVAREAAQVKFALFAIPKAPGGSSWAKSKESGGRGRVKRRA